MNKPDPKTILIVDDEESIRTLLREILKSQGYTILEARFNSEAFLRALQYAHHIDLMITDVLMPGVSGHELAKKLSPHRPDMKVLYISGGPPDSIREQLGDVNEALLRKPFFVEELLKIVAELLDRKPRRSRTPKKKTKRKIRA